jgi:hypothetical protein
MHIEFWLERQKVGGPRILKLILEADYGTVWTGFNQLSIQGSERFL